MFESLIHSGYTKEEAIFYIENYTNLGESLFCDDFEYLDKGE